jgi:hypothetical protein
MPSRAWLSCNTHSLDTEGMLNISAHELMETITDPFSSAWKGTYNEMADGCEWQFQSCVTLATGSFQLQQEWSNAAHACVQD